MDVVRLTTDDRAALEECARLMIASEPWITLGRTFELARATLLDPAKEVHAVFNGSQVAGFVILDMGGQFTGYIQTVCVPRGSWTEFRR